MPLVVVTSEAAGGEWVTTEEIEACAPSGADLELVADATAGLLFALSGHQFGQVTQTVRPYRTAETCGCAPASDHYSFSWTSHSAWGRAAGCACRGPSYLRLLSPVASVGAVVIDGETLDENAYTLWDGMFLVRDDGDRWPCCQDITKPSTEDGTWAVTYTHGEPVPAAGQLAAQVFACELAKAATGAADCQLAGRVQSVTRDGVSAGLVIMDADAMYRDGKTGIGVVDLWLSSLGNLRGGTITYAGGPRGLLRST